MAGVLKDTAEAVRSDLQTASDAGSFIRSFTAERSHGDWALSLTDSELHVDVVAVKTNIESEPEDRGSLTYAIKVDVAIRKRMVNSETEPSTGRALIDEVDELDLLTEQIHAHFAMGRPTTYDAATWDPENPPEIRASGPGGTLREKTQYVGIVRLAFLVNKAV